ncbi:MAG: hypothetical protein ACK4S2_07105 [Gemmobacter sp.]|uniref:hypothetical protein n=1 Tax=Gemmobacter sp. TaxID=1898957 RepID=UPI003919EDDF
MKDPDIANLLHRLDEAAEETRHIDHSTAREAATLIRRLMQPDLFWDDDGETGYGAPVEAWDSIDPDPDGVLQLRCAVNLPDIWVAQAVLTVDEAGDPDETELRQFQTKADALSCWPSTLAAAREAASRKGQPNANL